MWDLKPQDRLSTWRSIRGSIERLDIDRALTETTRLWSFAPYVNHYLDYQDPATWPDPWALLAENYYCDLAKTLGMLYTLYLTGHRDAHDFGIKIMARPTDKNIYNLVWIDSGKYILNYDFAEVVNISQLDVTLIELRHYSAQDLKLERYI